MFTYFTLLYTFLFDVGYPELQRKKHTLKFFLEISLCTCKCSSMCMCVWLVNLVFIFAFLNVRVWLFVSWFS